ncbi:SpoIIE family protein phosphatase [Cellulomonas sp. zg-Y338]|uniref:SpoIIE family protein phosphatase n=1 Tax=Cellulomonas chengniuliangii TaxID=2968084 RepID=A0ABY5L245_9CELL|nr:SpoIIE family protein phosphatase [Cellulomonas chengniuliangii]MCC2307701.1 SpoIIE family protein phosphatase [Cellulomonas chengniuliangii]UUI76862.1 SpoIIE family protein phosphatase [Cellulomonas chengniuliangii]
MRVADVPCFLLEDGPSGQHIVWVNDAFTRSTGFTLEQVRWRTPHVLYGEWTDREEIARLAGLADAGEPGTATICGRRADGSPFWSRVSVTPVPGEDGAPRTHWIAVLVDVTELVERDAAQTALVERERAERTGLGIVAQISDLLMDLDAPYTLREITRLLERGGVVSWAGFYLNDGGLSAAEGIDVTAPPSGRGHRHGNVPPDDVPTGRDEPDQVQLLLDGALDIPVQLDLTGWHATTSASGWLAEHVRPHVQEVAPGLTEVLVMAVPGRRRVMGVLVVIPSDVTRGAGLDALEDLARTVLQLTVRRVGLAVDNVRLYEREHRLAETLQRAMLPEQAEVVGLDVWSYYAPNVEHAQVGGDWYDVLQISPEVVGVVIGDVVGHDVEAAAAMGQLRSVVRSYAYEVTTPGPVLERVDQLVAGMRIPRSAALVLTTLSRDGEGWHVEYSRAGHLPALLVRHGVVTPLSDASGPLIGFGGRPRSTATAELTPGDVLIFYTDGLIERRDRALRDGVDALVDVAAGITAIDAAGIGEELLSRFADSPEDDVAVVVVRIPDPEDDAAFSGSPRSRRWLLPSEPASIGRARHAVLRTCQAWSLSDGPSAELVVSELVANAVLHGWGHIALRLYDTGEGLRIEVEDSNPTPPVATDGHPGRIGGYGMQIIDRLADWGWRPARDGKLVWAKVRSEVRPVSQEA